MICKRAFEIARSQADLWPLLKHIIKINLLRKSRETGFTLLCFKHSNGNNPSGQGFAGKCYQTADLLKYQCCDPRCPCIKNSCLLTEQVSWNGKSLFAKFDKGSLVNWNCVFDANEFISFSPPLLFRFCPGSYTRTPKFWGNTLWVLRRWSSETNCGGVRKATQENDTSVLLLLKHVLWHNYLVWVNFHPSACERYSVPVTGGNEAEDCLQSAWRNWQAARGIAAVDTSLPTNISSLVAWLLITLLKGWPGLYVIHQKHASSES